MSVRIRMKTFDGVCEMVSHGIGVAVMPKGIASRYRRRHAYRTLRLQDRWALRQLCLCHGDWQALCAPMKACCCTWEPSRIRYSVTGTGRQYVRSRCTALLPDTCHEEGVFALTN